MLISLVARTQENSLLGRWKVVYFAEIETDSMYLGKDYIRVVQEGDGEIERLVETYFGSDNEGLFKFADDSAVKIFFRFDESSIYLQPKGKKDTYFYHDWLSDGRIIVHYAWLNKKGHNSDIVAVFERLP